MPSQSRFDRNAHSEQRNTIGMCQAQLEELLERMSASQADENAVEKRAFVRWPLDNLNAQLELEENGRYRSKLTLAARNVSNSGISLLHSSFFYPGTPCRVTLPRRDVPKLSAVIEGHIMWCVHIEGLVHELGVKFDTPVDSSLFVTKMMASRRGNAAVSNSSLSGRLFLIWGMLVGSRMYKLPSLSLSKMPNGGRSILPSHVKAERSGDTNSVPRRSSCSSRKAKGSAMSEAKMSVRACSEGG